MIKQGNTVQVHYTGRLTNGDQFDSSVGRDPLKFTVGGFQVIEGFEKAVIGKSVGENLTVTIPCEEAYGKFRDDLSQQVPLSLLPERCKVGDTLQAMTEQGPMPVRIIEMNTDYAVIDGNHKLAGEDLIFDIEIVSIN